MSASVENGKQIRILVVEDNYHVAKSLVSLLSGGGYEVVGPVPTVAKAEAAVADESPDAGVLDYRIDEADSEPVARLLLQRGKPVIFLTGYGPEFERSQDVQSAPVLSKPVDPAELLKTLERLLGEAPPGTG